jgi:transposase
MDYWAKAPLGREQTLLFYPTLDDQLSEDHPARLLDEILQKINWSGWEGEYNGRIGQPPIPPRVVAAVILYGLMRGIRRSRQLEYLCGQAIDFMWLAEGRTIDHTTICKFRKRFRGPLKDLFRQVGRIAMTLGLVRLGEVAFDGTRVKGNASRFHTWTAERIEAALKELEPLIEKMLCEAEAADTVDDQRLGIEESGHHLPPELADLQARKARLQEVLEEVQKADRARKKDGIDPQKNPAQLPKADPDSKVMPNKEGGYAANYTPLVATDGQAGIIVDCDVIGTPNEQTEMLAAADRIEENFGQKPQRMLADAAFGTGANLAGMEARQIEFLTPVESQVPQEGNPAKREDPRQPVPEAEWSKLPRNDKKKLAKSCFVYDEQADRYYCPMGKPLVYEETKKQQRVGTTVQQRVYRGSDCAGCPLAGECRDPRGKHGRTIRRDEHEPLREKMYAKLQTTEGRATYNQRMHIAETPFAIIKALLGVRQFLLRGRENARTEWYWVCTAYNLKKLVAAMAGPRAKMAEMPAWATN